jgi:hypothetical protein
VGTLTDADVRLLREPDSHRPAVAAISGPWGCSYYLLKPLPHHDGAYKVWKVGEGEGYDILAGDRHPLCHCKGFLKHSYCRHVLAVQALLREGLLT